VTFYYKYFDVQTRDAINLASLFFDGKIFTWHLLGARLMEWAVILLIRFLDYLFICDGGGSIAIKVGNLSTCKFHQFSSEKRNSAKSKDSVIFFEIQQNQKTNEFSNKCLEKKKFNRSSSAFLPTKWKNYNLFPSLLLRKKQNKRGWKNEAFCILALLKHAHFSYVTKQKEKGKFMSFFNAEYLFVFLWPL
jgi:hypothetical protein